jgi:hypothetical protein
MTLRLNKAADARSLRELLNTQIKLVPEQMSHIVSGTRESFAIVVKGGSEARQIVKGSVTALGGGNVAAKAKAAKKSAKKVVKKAATSKPAKKTRSIGNRVKSGAGSSRSAA